MEDATGVIYDFQDRAKKASILSALGMAEEVMRLSDSPGHSPDK